MYVYLNDTLVQAQDATVPITDRGLRYGDGLFETLRIFNSRPYQWQFHLQRLTQGLTALRIPYDTAPLEKHVHTLISKNKVNEGLLRIAISRGSGGRGYLPPENPKPTLIIETFDAPAPPTKPLKLWLASVEKFSPRALPTHSKTAQGLNAILARMEAAEHGCDDALQLSAAGHIAETSSANIFWKRGNTLFTPSPATGALPGATRHALLRLSPWPVHEVEATLDELIEADAILLASTGLGVAAVGALLPQNITFESTDAAEQLQALLQQDMKSA